MARAPSPGAATAAVARYHDYLGQRVGTVRLSVLHQRLRDKRGLTASWATFYRYVQAHWRERLRPPLRVTVRLDDPPPGAEAQVTSSTSAGSGGSMPSFTMPRWAATMKRRGEDMARRRTHRASTASKVRRVPVLLALASVSLVFGAALVGGFLFLNMSSDGGPSPSPKTAAIVDQLSLTQPNPTFVDTATNILEQAGYVIDYYPGEDVTVDFYRDLPTHGYDLLILRVHSGMARNYGKPTEYVSLFSGEPFSRTDHIEETDAGRLGKARYYDGSPDYFSIVPDFIESSMRGRFVGTTVIMLGCDSLKTDSTAEAFVRKGAKAVVAWTGRVSASHTDAATEHLLRHLLIDRLETRDAVAQTMAEVGPDPTYDSTLVVYPSKP